MRIANLHREEHTAYVSIYNWVVNTEREPAVCVSFFYCLIERLAVSVVVLLT